MRKYFLLLGVLIPTMVWGQAAPVVRAKLAPADHLIVGQLVRLEVEVLVPNYFTAAPEYPSFELEGAIVSLSDDRPEHTNDRIAGTDYAGIRRSYVIYPEQPGKFTIPPAQVVVAYAGVPPATAEARLSLPPLSFEARIPPEAQGLTYFLPTTQLQLQQKWSPPPNQVQVGDSLSRTITVTAQKMRAMLIPPIPFAAMDGIRIYPANPSVVDQKTERGEFIRGIRSEQASYIFLQAGDFTLPEIRLSWWDLSANKLRTAKLPAANIHVDANARYVSELPPAPEPSAPPAKPKPNWKLLLRKALLIATLLLILLSCFWMLRQYRQRLFSFYRNVVYRRHESEEAFWQRLKKATKRNDPAQTYAGLLAWLNRSRKGMTLDAFQIEAADRVLDEEITSLSTTLFGKPETNLWNGSGLLDALLRHRRITPGPAGKARSLPELNPSASNTTGG